MADLYVYFYELGLRLLRPGGRLSYVVTNKWLRAGYAEELRGLLSSQGWWKQSRTSATPRSSSPAPMCSHA